MNPSPSSRYLLLLRNHLDLKQIPFSERGSRMLLFCDGAMFSIRLAERWAAWEAEFGHYRRRPPILRDFGLLDGAGAPLHFELTTYPHAIVMQTALGAFNWAFVDEETLYLQLPPAPCGVRFRVQAAQGHTDRRGGEFKGDPMHRRTHRNIAYTTNARITQNRIEASEGNYQQVTLLCESQAGRGLLLNITPRLGFNRSMPSASAVIANAERRWHEWFAAAPDPKGFRANAPAALLERQYYYAWWCMRAGLISPRFYTTRESMAPSKPWYVGMWHWDQFFHALAYRHVNTKLAEDQLRVLLDHQRADGMIADAVHDEGVVFDFPLPQSGEKQEVTKPPLIAWAALKLYERCGNLDFLYETYDAIKRWDAWWFARNDDDHDGIAQYNHPYSSGLDDSPLWDEGMPIESPELNTYLVMQADALARIAALIGEEADAKRWSAQAEALTQKIIAHFWDEKASLFWATKDHQPIRARTLFNLYPLLTGRLPQAMNDRLVEHLRSPQEFWTTYPLPTVAIGDPKFDANQMWRGPTWVNINYLFIEGLLKCGYHDLARELRDRTLALVMRHADIYEYYNPLDGSPPPKAASIFGWSSAVFIDLLADSRWQVADSGWRMAKSEWRMANGE
jgi:hypothetical protein